MPADSRSRIHFAPRRSRRPSKRVLAAQDLGAVVSDLSVTLPDPPRKPVSAIRDAVAGSFDSWTEGRMTATALGYPRLLPNRPPYTAARSLLSGETGLDRIFFRPQIDDFPFASQLSASLVNVYAAAALLASYERKESRTEGLYPRLERITELVHALAEGESPRGHRDLKFLREVAATAAGDRDAAGPWIRSLVWSVAQCTEPALLGILGEKGLAPSGPLTLRQKRALLAELLQRATLPEAAQEDRLRAVDWIRHLAATEVLDLLANRRSVDLERRLRDYFSERATRRADRPAVVAKQRRLAQRDIDAVAAELDHLQPTFHHNRMALLGRVLRLKLLGVEPIQKLMLGLSLAFGKPEGLPSGARLPIFLAVQEAWLRLRKSPSQDALVENELLAGLMALTLRAQAIADPREPLGATLLERRGRAPSVALALGWELPSSLDEGESEPNLESGRRDLALIRAAAASAEMSDPDGVATAILQRFIQRADPELYRAATHRGAPLPLSADTLNVVLRSPIWNRMEETGNLNSGEPRRDLHMRAIDWRRALTHLELVERLENPDDSQER